MMKRIVILLLVITGLYIVFNQSFQLDGMAFAGSKDERTAITNNIDTIEIDIENVSATVIPEDRKDVRAVLSGKGKISVDNAGNKVEVKSEKRWFNWFSFSGKRELNIYIPEDYYRNMVIDVGSGHLEFSGDGMKLDQLSVNIGSGDIDLNNLEVNEFFHDVSSGNVEIDTLKTKTGSFDISSGDLEIRHYSGAIKADVSSGEFTVQMDQLNDSIEIDLSSGEVNLDLPDNADFEVNGEVSSGDISSEFPLTSEGKVHKNIKGSHGSGKHKIDVSVSSGDLNIY